MLNIKRGDKVVFNQDVNAFCSNRVLVKKGTIATFIGGSAYEGTFLPEGKSKNVKAYYNYVEVLNK